MWWLLPHVELVLRWLVAAGQQGNAAAERCEVNVRYPLRENKDALPGASARCIR